MGPIRNVILIAGLALTVSSCGSDSPSSPSGNDGTIAATLTISGGSITPKTVTVPVGSRVTIVNNDSASHDMNSDPHPEHTQCPALNVGTLTSGQSRSSQNLTTARVCGMHVHLNPDNANLKATITVQ